jgi:alpha-1,6-mannosyltransferase
MSALRIRELLRDRYLWLGLVLVTCASLRATTGAWIGDFWSHSAAVREIAERPFSPRHPEIAAELPGVFYTPYTVAVAWFARIGHLSPITALAVAGMCNLVLLLIGLRVYARALFRRPDLVSFYAIVLVLFLWGPSPWLWSGFFHFHAVPFVLPYPSTFATGLMLLSLALHVQWLKATRSASLWMLCATSALLLLTHPVTALVYAIGLVAQTVGSGCERSWSVKCSALAAIAIVSAIGAAAWPYYPLFAAMAERGEYHEANAAMYVDVLGQVWPSLVAIPFLVVRLRANRRDPLTWMFIGLASLYVYGGFTGHFAYGRLISHAVMILQLILAAWLARFEWSDIERLVLPTARTCAIAAIVSVFALGVARGAPQIRDTVLRHPDWAGMYSFLGTYVAQDEVVLSDLESAYPVPTFAGKVVAHIGNMALVPDAAVRARDVDHFFNSEATDAERADILRRYNVKWLLLNQEHAASASIQQAFDARRRAVHVDESWVLMRVDRGD